MKRLLLFLALSLACLGNCQTLNEYLQLRKKLGISQAVGIQALETLIGTRTVEVQGTVKGAVSVEGEGTSILLEKTDGNTLCVNATQAPDWLSGNNIAVRIIVKATREKANEEIRATFIGAATESSVAQYEQRQVELAPKARSVRTMTGALKAAKKWSLPASEATPIYASFIKRRNSRLSPNEATRIAQGVVGFSLKYGVDARLIMAMLMVESGFNPNATSRTGAMGLGQLMPGTAAGMGVTNAYDSIDNLYGTVKLIRGHLERYANQTHDEYGSMVLALAAYNAGSGAVSRHRGVPPYRETQNYVQKVIGIYRSLSGR